MAGHHYHLVYPSLAPLLLILLLSLTTTTNILFVSAKQHDPAAAAAVLNQRRSNVYKNNQVDTRVLRFKVSNKWNEAKLAISEAKENRLKGCRWDRDCEGLDPYKTLCHDGRCIECITNDDCEGTTPICSIGTCVPCYRDDHCRGNSKCLATGACASILMGSESYRYVGCYRDDFHPYRQLGKQLLDYDYIQSGQMTPERCISFCQSRNFLLAGLEGGNSCFCGNSLRRSKVDDDGVHDTYQSRGCNFVCRGDSEHLCGGFDAISVYQADTRYVNFDSGKKEEKFKFQSPRAQDSQKDDSNIPSRREHLDGL